MSEQTLADALVACGFANDTSAVSYLQSVSDGLGMSRNGKHEVLAHFVKGDVSVTVEQNTAPEAPTSDGMSIVVTHPPCAIIEGGPTGRVAANPSDVQLILALVGEKSQHSLTPVASS